MEHHVLDRIARQGQLGEHGECDIVGVTPLPELEHLRDVASRIADRRDDGRSCDARESLLVRGPEEVAFGTATRHAWFVEGHQAGTPSTAFRTNAAPR